MFLLLDPCDLKGMWVGGWEGARELHTRRDEKVWFLQDMLVVCVGVFFFQSWMSVCYSTSVIWRTSLWQVQWGWEGAREWHCCVCAEVHHVGKTCWCDGSSEFFRLNWFLLDFCNMKDRVEMELCIQECSRMLLLDLCNMKDITLTNQSGQHTTVTWGAQITDPQ